MTAASGVGGGENGGVSLIVINSGTGVGSGGGDVSSIAGGVGGAGASGGVGGAGGLAAGSNPSIFVSDRYSVTQCHATLPLAQSVQEVHDTSSDNNTDARTGGGLTRVAPNGKRCATAEVDV
ncbi:hypothetical protein ON010_g4045 [Phytophthora cinnamomi]|nr:hypothetical protein ON010_g4045 [Phytophthora cinnamomi]